ncbi:MAG: dnaA3 [Chlamydiales bacterium]|jgi:chromosomal replication initiator protein|nr:dnaA3 [Chlamydiales bacterium]
MQAWQKFLLQQEKELGPDTVDKWLRSLKIVHYDACNLYLEANDTFQQEWFEEHIRHKIKGSLVNNNNKQIKVHVSAASTKEQHPYRSQSSQENSSFDLPNDKFEKQLEPFSFKFDIREPSYTLQSFIPVDGNKLAYQVICEATNYLYTADNEQKDFLKPEDPTFNPIYIYGGAGVGKTHLLMAMAQELLAHKLKAVYIRAETFTEHVVNAIRAGEMQTFRKAYRSLDALIIDDVQLFSRKGATQEELFHTFNALHIEGKQIVLAADVPPRELKDIEARLVSRFEWGIALSMQALPQANLKELIQVRTSALNFPLADDAIEFLINTFSSCKGIMRALDALVLRSHLQRQTLKGYDKTLPLTLVKTYLSDLIESEKLIHLTPEQLIQIVSEHYGIPVQEVLGKSQSRECVLPRKIAMFLCRKELELPFMKIGEIFERDHSTVMTSVKQIQKAYDGKDPEIAATIVSLLRNLQRNLGWHSKHTAKQLISSGSA